MTDHAIGVELSGRGATAVLVDGQGHVLKHADASGRDALGRAIKQVGGAARVSAIGVAADGAPALPEGKIWAGRTPLISPRGAAAITAEAWIGAAHGARHAICLWIGDHVFAGLLLGGTPWTGAHGLAGAAAWQAINPVDRQDYRQFGSLAAEVSNPGIAHRVAWRIQSGDASRVLDDAGSLEAITAKHVYDAAREGDGVAISVVRETAKYVAMAIANLVSTLDPEVLVLAGDLGDAGQLMRDGITHECARRLSPAALSHFRFELSTLGPRGIAIGAARLAATST